MTDEFDRILTDDIREAFVIAGRKGGKATARKYGSKHYRNIQKLSVERRLSPPMDEQIMELIGDGMSNRGIAKLMNVPLERVEEVKKQSAYE